MSGWPMVFPQPLLAQKILDESSRLLQNNKINGKMKSIHKVFNGNA